MNVRKTRIGTFIDRTLLVPLINFLKQGLTPKKLSLSIAFGVAFGIFPVIGLTTLLCIIAAFIFRLNMPSVQLVNFFVSPLQLIFLIPFVRLGELLFHQPPMPLNVIQIIAMIQSDFFGAVRFLWWTIFHAVAAWMLVAPFVVSILYYICIPVFVRLKRRSSVVQS